MKKFLLTSLALLSFGALNAQTILTEDFETGNTGSSPTPVAAGQGWTVINGYKGTNTSYNWNNYYANAESEAGATISGNCCASVDSPMVESAEDGLGPREEMLISPELDLNDTYQLQFTFRVSPMNNKERTKYDLQVRVITDDNVSGAETIFSIQNEKMLRESGIQAYPIDNWSPYTAKVDLSDFKGEKVKLAFVYKMYAPTANIVWLDDISVKKFTPAVGPQASVTLDRYDYGTLYIGEKKYTDVITLSNTGKDGLKITGVDLPEGVTITIDPSTVDLDKYKYVDFRLGYTASMTSAAQGNAVLHTTGGDVTIALTARKQFVPGGSMLETFETYFPPAGWVNNGWSSSTTSLEGDYSAYCGGGFGVCTLRSPRLDLLDGGTVTFTYLNYFADEEEELPYYDVELQVSTDGGDNWVTKWTSEGKELNTVQTVSVDLGLGDDNSYIRWMYPLVESDDEGALPHSTFYLDRVVLPNVYGMDGVPMRSSIVAPANQATEIYPRDVKLEWTPAQFATGYKLYLGTTSANDVIDGLDLKDALTYTLPVLNYETSYRWKIVPYNDKGDCTTAQTWRFTTQKDATVSTYPYEENFTGKGIPTGWNNTPSNDQYGRTWGINEIFPYVNDGKTYGSLYTMWLNKGVSNAINSPEFNLPEDLPMSISFIWGDSHPSDLVVDPTGTVKKENVEPNNGLGDVVFEIFADNEWKQLSYLSTNPFDDNDHKYWINEKVDLADYAGKTVQFRWVHNSYSGNDSGATITHVVIGVNKDQDAYFNKSGWNAGKVNFNKATNSGEIFSLLNNGTEPLQVKSATFENSNFSTSIKSGDIVPVDGSLQFSIQFDAQTTNAMVSDQLTVEFESGFKLELPVEGEALAKDTYYFSFEPNDLDLDWEKEFTMIDVDKSANYEFGSYWVHYTAGGTKCAFSVENDSKENGMYGMMAPVSGMHALVGASPANAAADNWIISKQMVASKASTFDFYARNLETLNSVLPSGKHSVTVLVSTTGNTNTSDFTPVMRKTEMPFLNGDEWHHYEVDLSEYAGKPIYVALQHTTAEPSNVAFFDDFRFSGFDRDSSGIESIEAAIADNAEVEVYSFSGVLVAKGMGSGVLAVLEKGLYIVKVKDGDNSRSFRIAK